MVVFISGTYNFLITEAYRLTNTNAVYLQCKTNLGIVNIVLPRISTTGATWGFKIYVVDAGNNASVNNITVTPNSADKINGSVTPITISTNGISGFLEITGTASWLYSSSVVTSSVDSDEVEFVLVGVNRFLTGN